MGLVIDQGALEAHIDENDGFCVSCGAFTTTGGVEPDAQGYECPDCGGDCVMGAEQALLEGLLDVVEAL